MRNAPILQSAVDTASQNFPAIPANQLFGISAMGVFSENTAAGTLKMQASNDAAPAGMLSSFTPTNWVDVPNTSQTITAGASVLIPFTQIAYQWVRFVFTKSGGAGTMQVIINVQGV